MAGSEDTQAAARTAINGKASRGKASGAATGGGPSAAPASAPRPDPGPASRTKGGMASLDQRAPDPNAVGLGVGDRVVSDRLLLAPDGAAPEPPRIARGGRADAERALRIQAAAKENRAVEDGPDRAEVKPPPRPAMPRPTLGDISGETRGPGPSGPARGAPASITNSAGRAPSERQRMPRVPETDAPGDRRQESPMRTIPRVTAEDRAALRRTADAMNRTHDLSGFEDILTGAAALDADATLTEAGILRGLLRDPGARDQLDGMLHRAMMRRVPRGRPAARVEPSADSPPARDSRDSDPRRGTAFSRDAYEAEGESGRVTFLVDPKTGARVTDLNGVPVSVGIDSARADGDLAPASDDMARTIDALAELKAFDGMDGLTPDRLAMMARQIDARYGAGTAIAKAFKGALGASMGLEGADSPDLRRALAAANALARDPATFAGMRANRRAVEAIPAAERETHRVARREAVEAVQDIRADLIGAEARLAMIANSPDRLGTHERSTARQQAIQEQAVARLVELAEAEAGRPGLPRPDLDPALARELGLHAESEFDRDQALTDAAIDGALTAIGLMPVAGPVAWAARAGIGAARTGKAVAGTKALALAAESARATGAVFQEAAREGYETLLADHGVDPDDPDGWSKVPEAARRAHAGRLGTKALVHGASPVAAMKIVDKVLSGAPAIVKAAAEQELEESATQLLDQLQSAPNPK